MKRDAQTFLEVMAANKGIVYKVANSYCKDSENRKDLIQEIMIQLWLAFNKYDETYKLSTWMYRIALNVSISFYRKESRRDEINQSLPDDILYIREESAGELDAEVELLHQFIKELKEIDRAVIILYLEGTDQKEIGEILGFTMTNVSTKILRIKEQLRKKFSTFNN